MMRQSRSTVFCVRGSIPEAVEKYVAKNFSGATVGGLLLVGLKESRGFTLKDVRETFHDGYCTRDLDELDPTMYVRLRDLNEGEE